jgi:hypothetical protein
MIIWNINTPLSDGVKIQAINDEQKARLISRIEILSAITWMFLVIMIAVM